VPKNNEKPASILLVDDHPVVVAGLQAFIGSGPEFSIVGVERSASGAIRRARDLQPELILLDATLPDMLVAEATRLLAAACPRARILVLAADTDQREQARVARAGAAGYVAKDAQRDALVGALRVLMRGDRHFSADSAASSHELDDDPPSARDQETSSLSRRELEVLVRIAEGSTNKQIADRLGISVRTVETHRENLMRKLGVQGTAALTKWAVSRGLVDPRK
jgi:two-component system, NarL family, nitrate/nitrite response regulator NarL